MTANACTDSGRDKRNNCIVDIHRTRRFERYRKYEKIDKVVLKVALKDAESVKSCKFSRSWTPPCTILRIAAGPPVLVNVQLLDTDAELPAEDLFIGLPVLKLLVVDTKNLLAQKSHVLGGLDISEIAQGPIQNIGGNKSGFMNARLNDATDDPEKYLGDSSTRVDNYRTRGEDDHFPYKSLLNPLESAQHGEDEK